MPGFLAAMDAARPWAPRSALLATAEPVGAVEQACFDAVMARWRAGLAALRGAGLTTAPNRPEGVPRAPARFDREAGEDPFARPLEAPAEVRALSNGDATGRRGSSAGRACASARRRGRASAAWTWR